MEYETVIGLEVHLQLSTKTKAFCGCGTKFGEPPNSQTCPVCLGFPGSLPVLNKEALYYAIKAALALNCEISRLIKFDRKNYFYPDLPKNFQISQYDMPLSHDGHVDIGVNGKTKRVGIKRVHLEEDAGKLIHQEGPYSMVDFNRSGIPLLEIVSEPDISSPDEAYEYLLLLKSIFEYLEVSTCSMEEGSLRCDANLSLRPVGSTELGTKIEVKNMNSFKAVRGALQYEVDRQKALLDENKKLEQETRLWDADGDATSPLRSKEEAHDYRYFPEPDLAPFTVSEEEILKIKKGLPELPQQRKARFAKDYDLSEYDAGVLIKEKALADYFEECVKLFKKPKLVANWLMGDLLAHLNVMNKRIEEITLKPQGLVELLKMVEEKLISGKIAKDVMAQMLETGKGAKEIVEEKKLVQITDTEELGKIAEEVIHNNPKPVADYKKGKEKAITFLVGQFMAKTKGKANPELANEILKEKLRKR